MSKQGQRFDNQNARGPRGSDQGRRSEFQEEVISIDRISRMTSGGRRIRFRAVMAIGDGKAKLGYGIAKANDVAEAINKAKKKAEKDMIDVYLVDGTIPYEMMAEFGSAKVLFKPAAPGTGIIAGGSIRKALELAGVENILSKALGSQNKINNLKATYYCLKTMAEDKERFKPKTK